MARVEIVFESRYGQTAKIAEYVATTLRRRGHVTKLVQAPVAIESSLGEADGIVVLAPVYFGRHPRASEAFVRLRADAIAGRPSMFLSVSGAAGSAEGVERAKALRLAKEFLEHTGAEPKIVGIVGGAMAYPKYNFVTRWIIKRISKRRGGPTDTTRTHEATDWRALDALLDDFFPLLEPRKEREIAVEA